MLFDTPIPVVVFKEPNDAPFLSLRAVKKDLIEKKQLASSIGTHQMLSCFLNQATYSHHPVRIL